MIFASFQNLSWVAPMKAYLKNYERFKNSYLKKFLYHKQESLLANLDPDCFICRKMAMVLKLVHSFINFVITLPATFIRDSWCNLQKVAKCLLKQIQRFVRLLHQKDCWGTVKVNDVFKILPPHIYFRRVYSWNLNTVIQTSPILHFLAV